MTNSALVAESPLQQNDQLGSARHLDAPILAMAYQVTALDPTGRGIATIRDALRIRMSLASHLLIIAPTYSDIDVSLWQSPLSVRAFLQASHSEIRRLRQRWGLEHYAVQRALWWVTDGRTPDGAEATARLRHLRDVGPSAEAFTLRSPVPPPQASRRASTAAARSSG